MNTLPVGRTGLNVHVLPHGEKDLVNPPRETSN